MPDVEAWKIVVPATCSLPDGAATAVPAVQAKTAAVAAIRRKIGAVVMTWSSFAVEKSLWR